MRYSYTIPISKHSFSQLLSKQIFYLNSQKQIMGVRFQCLKTASRNTLFNLITVGKSEDQPEISNNTSLQNLLKKDCNPTGGSMMNVQKVCLPVNMSYVAVDLIIFISAAFPGMQSSGQTLSVYYTTVDQVPCDAFNFPSRISRPSMQPTPQPAAVDRFRQQSDEIQGQIRYRDKTVSAHPGGDSD